MAKKAPAKGGNGKKRKVSGKRGSAAKRRTREGVDPRGVAGIVILCVGLLALASQFIPSDGGFLRQCMLVGRGLGGTLCLLLPLVICWAGVTLVFFGEKKVGMRSMICGALIFLFVETLLQLFQVGTIASSLVSDGKSLGYGGFLARSYEYAALDCRGGGLIGALLAWPLYLAVDIWGGVIVMIFALTLVLMVMTGVSFGSVGMYVSEWIDDFRVEYRERKEERTAMRAVQEEERLSREAEQRQKKREESERAALVEQQAREEALAAQRDAKQQAVQPTQEQESSAPKRKGRKKAAQEPIFEGYGQPEPRNAMQTGTGEHELYIERSDEFERASIDEVHDPRESYRRGSFTIQEAEEAFLFGMNAQNAARQTQEEEREEREDVGAFPYADVAGAAPEESPAYDGQNDAPEEEQPSYGEQTEENAFELPAYAQEETMGNTPSSIPASGVHRRRVRQPVQQTAEEAAQAMPAKPIAGAAQYAAKWAETDRSGIERSEEDKTIVQLRANRMDGTPLVMPRRDEHDGPQRVEEVYTYPPIDLLNRSGSSQDPNQRARDEAGARKLIATLESFGVQAKMTHVTHGPAITRYELQPAPGVKVSRIVNLVDDIALNMASDGVRIEAPIPGKPAVGIEIPNEKIEMVSLRDVLESPEMTREKSPTAVALGKGISGAPVVADMARMPHVLIAGATGSGKSVCINTIINSIIYRATPQEVRLILIDPKVVELSVYNGIPHLLVPVVTDPKKASAALSWAVVEMEHRYKRFETMGVRDIRGYNNAIGPLEEPMSKIIVIIDELADLMMVAPGEVEESICRLAQLARAAGIHLVIATQRPSVNVITGVIKANIPSRIAFAVSSQIDSRTILDSGGAEKLLGKGDMLYAPQGASKPTRVQGCFVSDDEVQRIVDFVRGKHSADYNEDVIEQMNTTSEEEKNASSDAPSSAEPVDEMLNKAIELAVEAGQVSISMLQRRLRVGYARAGRLVDEMTLRGITGEAEGPTKPRAVLISREEWKRMQENQE